MDEKVKEIMNLLKPEIEKTIQAYANGKLKEEMPNVVDSFLSKAFDKAMEEIGKKLNLAPNVIKKLQGIDEFVVQVTENLKQVKNIANDVKEPTKMLIISYPNLQKEKKKSAMIWSIMSFLLGIFSGGFLLFKIIPT